MCLLMTDCSIGSAFVFKKGEIDKLVQEHRVYGMGGSQCSTIGGKRIQQGPSLSRVSIYQWLSVVFVLIIPIVGYFRPGMKAYATYREHHQPLINDNNPNTSTP